MARFTSPWLVAPMDASAVILFALPSSPLDQPWAVVGGNNASALIGIAIANFAHGAQWGGAAPVLAGAGAVGMMIALRCLHPPGGAAALLVVLGGVVDWRFALFPVGINWRRDDPRCRERGVRHQLARGLGAAARTSDQGLARR